MTKYISIKSHPIFIVNEIYIIDILSNEGEWQQCDNYIEIYDINCRYIGGWFLNLDKFFMPLAEWRELQINNILND